MAKLAIVIPYFKIAYFERAIKSLINQTNKNFSLYIGNDASPQDPSSILNLYSSSINFIYKKFPDNLGKTSLSKQWDRCIDLVKNEKWILILGDDDYVCKDFVHNFYKHINLIEEKNIKVIRNSTRILNQENNPSGKYEFPVLEKSTDFFCNRYFNSSRSSLSEYIFEKNTYKEIGFRELPLAWGTDSLAWLEFTNGGKIYTINDSTVYIQIFSESISGNGFQIELKDLARFRQFQIVIRYHFEKFSKEQKKKLLLFFESRARKVSKAGELNFYFLVLKKTILMGSFLEALKFTRRFLFYVRKY